MGRQHDTGLAWKGHAGPPSSGGGFVGDVGLNQKTHDLAVDPDAVVGPRAPRRTGSGAPMLSVDRMDDDAEPSPRNGRVRLP